MIVPGMTPDEQRAALEQQLALDDAMMPVPVVFTGQGIPTEQQVPESVIDSNMLVAADLVALDRRALLNEAPEAYTTMAEDWYNDDQFFGLGVPPGVPNDQPFESGASQAVQIVPSLEAGWDAWSGRAFPPPVARMENAFPGYNAGTSRGHVPAVEKYWGGNWNASNEIMRQMILTELYKRGVHNVVIANVEAVPYTETVLQVDPSVYGTGVPIGAEGVVPSW